MKSSQRFWLAFLGSTSLALGTAASGEQLIANLDFGPSDQVAVGLAAFASGTATDVWNNRTTLTGLGSNPAAPNTQALVGPDGSASGISYFAGSGPDAVNSPKNGGGNTGAFNVTNTGPFTNPSMDYAYSSNNPANTGKTINGVTVDIAYRFTLFDAAGTKLDNKKLYDIYIFGGGDKPGQGASFVLRQDGTDGPVFLTKSYAGTPVNGNPTTYEEGGNLVIFENVSPTTIGAKGREFELSGFSPLGANGTITVGGIQIVEVPEPS
ncbi:MAG: hypothetical protein AAGG38_01785 [Planctomycetota bacterium]